MKFKEIKFIKDWCIALVQDNDKYIVILGKCGKVKFQVQQDAMSMESYYYKYITEIVNSLSAKIEIPFIKHDDTLYTIINLNHKEEYNTIKSVLEVVL